MCIDKLYDKIIRNSKEAERQYLSMANNMISSKKCNKSPLTDEAFKEQLERVLRNNVFDTDIRITGDTVIGAKINPEDKGLFLRSLSDEAILKECKERGLDVKYSEEKNLAYRLNWVMQDYYKAGEDEEEREHRVKCYKLFWDALEDSEFFNRLESQKEELTKLQEKCKKFVENQKEQKPEDTMDEFTRNIRNLITDKLTVHTKGLDGSEVSSTVFIDDKTAKDIASGVLFYVGKEAVKNPNREIPEWSEEDEHNLSSVISLVHSTSDGAWGSCIGDRIENWLKSLRPQINQGRQIKEGDKVRIHCRKDRKGGRITIYDGKVGEVIDIWDAKRNPWGHIGVRLDNGCNDGFYEDELEVIDEPSWKPSEEQMNALLGAKGVLRNLQYNDWAKILEELYEQLKEL